MKQRLFLIVASAMLALSLGACKVNKVDNSSSGNSSGNSSSGSVISSSSSSASDSGSPSSSSSEGPQFADTDYTVKVNSGEAIKFTTQGEEEILDEGVKIGMQYQCVLAGLHANDVLTFFKQGVAITPYAGGTNQENNVACNLSTMELTIVKDATSTCYFKAYDNGTYDLWLTGNEGGTGGGNYTPTPESGYYLKGTFNEWQALPSYKMASVTPSEAGIEEEYVLECVNLAASEEFKVYDAGADAWYGYDILDLPNTDFAEGADLNIATVTTGAYDVSFRIHTDTSKTIKISKNAPADLKDVYLKGSFNSWDSTNPLYKLEEEACEDLNVEVQYSIKGQALAKDAEFVIHYGDDDIGFTGVYEGKSGLEKGDDDHFKVSESATFDLYFKVYKNDAFGLWVNNDIVVPPHGPDGSTLVDWWLVGDGSIFTDSWSTAGGVQLYSNPSAPTDKACILSLTLEVGDKFKVTDGADIWFGYEKVDTWDDPSNAGLNCFEAADDGFEGFNFRCTVAGTYDMYINNSGTFWIQVSA